MADDNNQELKIHIVSDADNSGFKSAAEASGDLGKATDKTTESSQDLTRSMPDNLAAWDNYSRRLGGASESSETFNMKGKEMKRLLLELNQVAPGLGTGIHEIERALAAGVGPLIVFTLAIETAMTYWELYKQKSEAAAESQIKSLDQIREAFRSARTEQEEFQKAMDKASKPDDQTGADLANKRAVLAAQFSGRESLLRKDEAAEQSQAKTPEARAAVQQKFEGRRAQLQSEREAAEINLLQATLDQLEQQKKQTQSEKETLQDSRNAWSTTITTMRNLGLNTDHAAGELAKVNAHIKEIDDKLVETQTKLTRYGGESGTAASVHGINDFTRSASENRVISKAVMDGIDPAARGVALNEDQRNANAALTELFSHYSGGIAQMMAIIRNHIQHSTSQAQEMKALKNSLAYLQQQVHSQATIR